MLLCWAYRMGLGALLALGVSGAASGVVGAHPRGDALLFDPGGMWLFEAARLAAPAIRAQALGGVAITIVGALLWLVPLGALAAAVDPASDARFDELVRRAVAKLPAHLVLRLATMVAQALAVALAVVAGHVLAMLLHGDGASVAKLCGVLAGLVTAWLIGVLEDAVRVPLVARQLVWHRAIASGWEIVRARPLAALGAAGARSLVSLVAFVWALWLATAFSFGVDAPLVVNLAPCVAVAVLVVMRAEWLAWLARRLPRGGDEATR